MTYRNLARLPDDASLDLQIRRIEQRLNRHRVSSKAHRARFRWQLREGMTSPLMLLLASGLGFALGASSGSKPAPTSSHAGPRAEGIRLLSTMVSMVSLAGSVVTLWQRFKAVSRSRPTPRPERQENTPQ
ncbi:MAG TPA: hypothetical protein PLN31_09115 [Azoarcus taiwanensis]|nr:hypothetical protein [Azoarcus taiwanensis]